MNGTRAVETVEPVVIDMHLPAGTAGPKRTQLRCSLPGSAAAISTALTAVGAAWEDVSDVVLTHAHYDHVGGLPEVARLSPGAAIWIGGADLPDVSSLAGLRLRPVEDQDRIRQFQILHTPGHTPGHLSLLQEDSSVLLLGDLAAMMNDQLVRAPAVSTADPALCERSLRRAADLAPRRILPSHGPELPTPPARVLIDLLDPLPTTAQD